MGMQAVILAGGRGTRLAPYTTTVPKPLMPLGDMPILEVVLRQLRSAGFDRVAIAVGHLAGLIQAFFQDGSQLGVDICYSLEPEPLGTAGPLTLIPNLDETFVVMNGDTLTTLDYGHLVEHHRASGAAATIATHERSVQIDFGILEEGADGQVKEYIEKPSYDYRVSMGVYVFERRILEFIGRGQRLDFPDLVRLLLDRGERVQSYPFDGYWLDIGRHSDYELAAEEFQAKRDLFLPEGT